SAAANRDQTERVQGWRADERVWTIEKPVRQFLPRNVPCFTARKATVMSAIVFAMIIILAVAATIVGLVAVGLQGRGRDRAPRLAEKRTFSAEHPKGRPRP